jgi:nitrite reductase/ring-hydroxylating ferredoxin subunit
MTDAMPNEVPRLKDRFAAYYRARNVERDHEIVQVDRGTPGGEYLRRTWQPVCLAEEIGDLPKVVRILGEDFVVFRTRRGDVGLIARHCSHRGASLEYGLPTDRGITCCYHGWHIATDGTILETPNDPGSTLKDRIYHPAYPTHEFNGIVFAWMGPPENVPAFPLLDAYVQPDVEAIPFSLYFPCNWIQVLDNTQDPTHSCFLHTRVSGAQFAVSWGELPELEYLRTPTGMINLNVRRWGDKVWVRTTDVMMPNLNQTGHLWLTAEYEETFLRTAITRWMRPIDETQTQMIGWRYFSPRMDRDSGADRSRVGLGKIDFIGQTEDERPYAERQRVPGDFEAIAGQGAVAFNAAWNLNHGDRGVAMMRKLIRDNIEAVRAGTDYLAIERVPAVGGIVPTYTQDTVLTLPPRSRDDRAFMRDVGAKVAEVVFASAKVPEKEREAFVRRRTSELAAAVREVAGRRSARLERRLGVGDVGVERGREPRFVAAFEERVLDRGTGDRGNLGGGKAERLLNREVVVGDVAAEISGIVRIDRHHQVLLDHAPQRMRADVADDSEPHIRERTDGERDARLREAPHQRGILESAIAVVDAVDLEDIERLPDIGRRTLLAGMGHDAEAERAGAGERFLELARRVADLG